MPDINSSYTPSPIPSLIKPVSVSNINPVTEQSNIPNPQVNTAVKQQAKEPIIKNSSEVIKDVNVAEAKAVISVINNDSLNLEIGLNARSHQPNVKMILRIFDDQMADKIKDYLKIYHALSASAIANESFYNQLNKAKINF